MTVKQHDTSHKFDNILCFSPLCAFANANQYKNTGCANISSKEKYIPKHQLIWENPLDFKLEFLGDTPQSPPYVQA
jgi:hypothetical protein